MEVDGSAVVSSVRLAYDAAMRLHITIKDETMAAIRQMAKTAGCIGDNDRETLQKYLHFITNAEPPQWGGARVIQQKPSKKSKKE